MKTKRVMLTGVILGAILAPMLAYSIAWIELTHRPPEPLTREEIARIELEMIERSLLAFHSHLGRYPTDDEGLSALIRNPGVEEWRGPYLPWVAIPLSTRGKHFQYEQFDDSFRVWDAEARQADLRGLPASNSSN